MRPGSAGWTIAEATQSAPNTSTTARTTASVSALGPLVVAHSACEIDSSARIERARLSVVRRYSE